MVAHHLSKTLVWVFLPFITHLYVVYKMLQFSGEYTRTDMPLLLQADQA